MKLLVFVLNKTDKLDAVLMELAGKNITGATVIESAGMARLLCKTCDEDEVPVLSSIRAFLHPERERSNTIFMVTEDSKIEVIIDTIESVIGDLSKKDTGIVFTIPLDFAKGLYKNGK